MKTLRLLVPAVVLLTTLSGSVLACSAHDDNWTGSDKAAHFGDHYRLDPEQDAIFAGDNPGVVLADIRETSVSPKLGMVWKFAPDWSLFGGYARGFRSPPYNDVNIGFTNVQFGYTAIANPDLKPETSDGLEFGARYAGDVVYASLSGYYNRYDDFIESMRFIGFNDDGLMVYQSQKVA